ncbi:MAG TPA: hypothetical protein VGW58_06245 [Pyrinomonadaceae bacterium]|nr:hypothetical protein [Pyrinomonadaceae bacterium]
MQQCRKALLSFSAVLIVTCACSQTQRVATEPSANETIVSSTPPFQTREPERYRATRTITTVNARGETLVTKNVIARDGDLRRDESETAGQQVVYLTLPEGRFLILPAEKLFAEAAKEDVGEEVDAGEDSETSPDRLLHTELITTGYQRLGAEIMGGRKLEKYRVVVNNSAGENVSVGETFLWFDDALHMPVRTESTSPDGTRTTMELSDIVLDVRKELFQLPKDFQKAEFAKLRERLNLSKP